MKDVTLRDRLAMAALQGLVVANGHQYSAKGTSSAAGAKRLAALAYELADAMLAERENPPPLD